MRTDPYPGYSKCPHRGEAYKLYLRTGDVVDVWGRTTRGSGPPQHPMTEHEFYAAIQKAPKPGDDFVVPFSEAWREQRYETHREQAQRKFAQSIGDLTRRITGEVD